MYDRDKQDPMKEYVEHALAEYAKDINNVGAGYHILNYASKGLLEVDESISAKEFLDWYPCNPSYVILRIAAKGKFTYKAA